MCNLCVRVASDLAFRFRLFRFWSAVRLFSGCLLTGVCARAAAVSAAAVGSPAAKTLLYNLPPCLAAFYSLYSLLVLLPAYYIMLPVFSCLALSLLVNRLSYRSYKNTAKLRFHYVIETIKTEFFCIEKQQILCSIKLILRFFLSLFACDG
jgi:hypothetical protein